MAHRRAAVVRRPVLHSPADPGRAPFSILTWAADLVAARQPVVLAGEPVDRVPSGTWRYSRRWSVAEPVPPRHRRRERRRARPARPADGTPREYARAAPEAPTEVGPPGGADGTERDGTERDGTQRDGTQRDGTQRDGTQRDGTERSDLPAEPR